MPAEPEITAPSTCVCRAADSTRSRWLDPKSVAPHQPAGWGRSSGGSTGASRPPTGRWGSTISHIDYLACIRSISWTSPPAREIDEGGDRAAGTWPRLAEHSGGVARARTKKVSIDLIPNTGGLRLVARTERVDADIQIARPDGHESMGA